MYLFQDFSTSNDKENTPSRLINERKRNRLSSEEDTPSKLLKARTLYLPSSEEVSPSKNHENEITFHDEQNPSVFESFDAVQPSTSGLAPSNVNLEEDLYLSSVCLAYF